MDVETEYELTDEVPICMVTEEVVEKPTMVVPEKLLLVPELKGAPVGKPLKRRNWLQVNKM